MRSVLLIGGATLLALLLLLTLLTLSRRHYLDRIALEAEAKRQLEERVLERTRELENANAQLQQEVHEREQAQRELMRAQDEVVQAGKLTALGTMSASISHELNQPLAAIRSYADNARVLLDHQRTEDARGNLEQISDLTTRMASIIAHLKAYARGARRAPENVQLQPAIEDALSMVASRRRAMNVELLRDVPDAPLWVQAGETRLRQILGNLLTNALDALAEKAPPRRLWVIASQDQHGVTLTLRDNGPGFSEDALAHAHEPFFTTKTTAKGLGLGLAICDNLLRALGGRLEMGNHLEGGAVVRLHCCREFPASPPCPRRKPAHESFAPFDAQTQVLLIDDDPHLRQALRQTLDLAGLKVATLDDARQLDTAQCKDWPGVVVSDIRMPGIDGMELLRQLHEQDSDLPVILITGHGDVPLAVQAMRGGAYDFWKSPSPATPCSTACAAPWRCAGWSGEPHPAPGPGRTPRAAWAPDRTLGRHAAPARAGRLAGGDPGRRAGPWRNRRRQGGGRAGPA